jgi:hypothetical protein
MDLNQQLRWQHVVLIIAALGVVIGIILTAGAFFGPNSPGHPPPPWWLGTSILGAALLVGWTGWTLLLRDLARGEWLKWLDEGLFELPAGASRDLARLSVALRQHFGVAMESGRVAMPPTLGEVVRTVADHVDSNAQIRPRRLDAVRRTLGDLLHCQPESIPWSTRLPRLIPRGRQRFATWEGVRAVAPSVPPVELSVWVENLAIYGFLAALIAIAVPIAQKLDSNPSTRIDDPGPGGKVAGHALGLIVFAAIIAVLMIPVYAIGRKYSSRLPVSIATMADLAWHFPDAGLAAEGSWTPQEVRPHVLDLVAEHLNLARAELRDDMRLL